MQNEVMTIPAIWNPWIGKITFPFFPKVGQHWMLFNSWDDGQNDPLKTMEIISLHLHTDSKTCTIRLPQGTQVNLPFLLRLEEGHCK